MGEEPTIRCDNSGCGNGQIFHVSCVHENLNDIPDPWYCSPVCQRGYRFCICKTDMGPDEPMIGCDNQMCSGKWFHYSCVGIDDPPGIMSKISSTVEPLLEATLTRGQPLWIGNLTNVNLNKNILISTHDKRPRELESSLFWWKRGGLIRGVPL